MERWNRLLTRPALRSGYSGGNRLQFFTDGDRTFRAVWDDIARAEERVWMETYVYEPDAVGRRTRHALAEAAQRGCDVVLIYDSQGSASVTEDFFRPLREAGGTVLPFNPVYPWHRLQRRLMNPLHRDHRKLLIVDDRVASSLPRSRGPKATARSGNRRACRAGRARAASSGCAARESCRRC